MILQILFTIIFSLLGVLLFFLPGYGEVPLKLPWGIDELMQSIVGVFNTAIDSFPYLGTLSTIILLGIGFEIAMMFIKLFLGHRAPSHNID